MSLDGISTGKGNSRELAQKLVIGTSEIGDSKGLAQVFTQNGPLDPKTKEAAVPALMICRLHSPEQAPAILAEIKKEAEFYESGSSFTRKLKNLARRFHLTGPEKISEEDVNTRDLLHPGLSLSSIMVPLKDPFELMIGGGRDINLIHATSLLPETRELLDSIGADFVKSGAIFKSRYFKNMQQGGINFGPKRIYGSLGMKHPYLLKELVYAMGQDMTTLAENVAEDLDYGLDHMDKTIGTLPIRQNILFFVAALDAARSLHAGNEIVPPAVHGDFTPDNTFILKEGTDRANQRTVRLADMEASREFITLGELQAITGCSLIGNPAFHPVSYAEDLGYDITNQDDAIKFFDTMTTLDYEIIAATVFAMAALTGKTEDTGLIKNYRKTGEPDHKLPNPNDYQGIPKEIAKVLKKAWTRKPSESVSIDEILGAFIRVYGIDLKTLTMKHPSADPAVLNNEVKRKEGLEV